MLPTSVYPIVDLADTGLTSPLNDIIPRRSTFSSKGIRENELTALEYFSCVKNFKDLSSLRFWSSPVF